MTKMKSEPFDRDVNMCISSKHILSSLKTAVVALQFYQENVVLNEAEVGEVSRSLNELVGWIDMYDEALKERKERLDRYKMTPEENKVFAGAPGFTGRRKLPN